MKKKYVVLLDMGLVALALAARWLTAWMMSVIPDCPVTRFGLLCPACGGTRCVRSFLAFQWGTAVSLNPFFFVLIWYLGLALILLNVGILGNVRWAKRIAGMMLHWRMVVVAAVLFGLFGVVRNFG